MTLQQQVGRFVGHVLSASVRRDGAAAMLQREALEEGRLIAADVERSTVSTRPLPASPQSMLLDSLSAKVLGGWLQNRHQTLYPLAMNFRNISAEHTTILLDVALVALLVTGEADEPRLGRVHSWLATVGGDHAHRDQLASRLPSAPTLHDVVGRVLAAHLGPLAYAVALATLDQREPVNRLFLEFFGTRLGLPSDMLRSLAQRYRL